MALTAPSSRVDEVPLREGVPGTGLQVSLEPDRQGLGLELNAHIDGPRLPWCGGAILSGVVRGQPRRHVACHSNVATAGMSYAADDVDK